MKYLKGALLLCLLTLVTAPAREAKERDKDLNYDEATQLINSTGSSSWTSPITT